MLVASGVELILCDGTKIKADAYEFGRRGTKSPNMIVYMAGNKRYTPIAIRHYRIKITLNTLFKVIYSRHIRNLIPDGVKLMSKIHKEPSYSGSMFHMPVILGQEHGVNTKKKGQ